MTLAAARRAQQSICDDGEADEKQAIGAAKTSPHAEAIYHFAIGAGTIF
jgi:hypothetical protein